ncbi:hypothetical protein [Fischerella sp. PCC 9605]|uniref:hypothetical protein n=1 Tax=Fischerella sp. PCC 9605 TaxID=1173024 RepID=UPI0004788A34|nr:hypothetical protein [Fischerella sp. PCC 9605]
MKNNHFSQVTALVMGLLIIFSGQALSFSSNHKDLSNGNALGNSEFVVAQENVSVGVAVAVAVKVLNQAVSVVQTVARTVPVNVPSKHRDIILPKLIQAQKSMAKAQSSAQKGDNFQVATAVSQAVAFMGEAQGEAKGDAGSVQAITKAIVKANEALGAAQAQTRN